MDDERWRGLLPDTVRAAGGPVYHYTDSGGLVGLIQNHELWATEATGMNDLAEVRQGWDFIRAWVKAQPSDLVTDVISDACGEEDDDYRHPVRDEEGVFMCCASTRRDDANQWRLYGGEGRGYSVELLADEPLAAISRKPAAPTRPAKSSAVRAWRTLGESAAVSPWLHVLYTDQEKRAALEGLATNAREAWARASGQWKTQEARDEGSQEFRDSLLTDVAVIAQLVKSEGFSGEREVRVIVVAIFDSCSRFRATANGVVRYVPLTARPSGHPAGALVYDKSLGESKTLPVKSVWLGPLIHAQNNERTIQALLSRNRLKEAGVQASKVPLRG